jgi:hypothetical protein
VSDDRDDEFTLDEAWGQDGELFPADGMRVAPSPEEEGITQGERLRRRQAARIAAGYHPLAMGGSTQRLHPDADRALDKDAPQSGPTCGTCRFRETVGGHARSFPKCLWGYVNRPMTDAELAARPASSSATRVVYYGPRYANSESSDVRAWWPACTDHQPREETP